MSDVVIRAEGLGKRYVIGHEAEGARYETFRDTLARQARGLARSAVDLARGRPMIQGDEREEFWALQDVSFEIRRGEVVGIIGRNGAGKSTLLKVLSRITEPTLGRVTIEGRVASLLEVGTGFHPELTGRENVYLNGAILGMTRAEIRRKFDEIVAFAGVEKFLDTPVKRYSSGMQVRLGFAVAAHLEPEILVVDEVLAVGDAEFQKKCLGKMQDVAGHGRTVLFVSHNMAAVTGLCQRGIVLAEGRTVFEGTSAQAVETYLAQFRLPVAMAGGRPIGNDQVQLLAWRVVDEDGEEFAVLDSTKGFSVEIRLRQRVDLPGARALLKLCTAVGDVVFATTDESRRAPDMAAAGDLTLCADVPANLLNTGSYELQFRVGRPGVGIVLDDTPIARLEVRCERTHGSLRLEGARWPGVVAPAVGWTISRAGTVGDAAGVSEASALVPSLPVSRATERQ